MAFIETLSVSDVTGNVRAMYARQQEHYGFVPNYAKVFCHRPEIMGLWAQLQAGIKRHMDKRRFELITFAAAHELRSTLCTVAHGKALLQFLSAEDVAAIARREAPAALSAAELAMIDFARCVARDASAIAADDVQQLKDSGFSDGEIFDVAAAAAARAFWTKVIESLGVSNDAPVAAMDAHLRDVLAVGRPIRFAATEKLPEVEPYAVA